MDAELSARLEAIEDRLATVERALEVATAGAPPARVERAGSPTTRPFRTPPARPRATDRTRDAGPSQAAPVVGGDAPRDLEGFLGVAVLGRIGIAAVLLAAGYFAQLAYKELGDVAKVLSLYGLSGALIAAGFLLRTRVVERYVALLWGGGGAIAYLAAVAARLRYDLVSSPVAFGLLVLAAALTLTLARRLRNQALASIAVLGALASPLLVASPHDQRTVLFAYLILVQGFGTWLSATWRWPQVRAASVAGATVVAVAWALRHGGVDVSTWAHLHALLLALVVPELRAARRGAALSRARAIIAPVGVGLAEASLLFASLPPGPGLRGLPAFGALAGIGWLALASVLPSARTSAAGRALVARLALVGGVLLVLGTVPVTEALPAGLPGPANAQRVVLLAAATLALLLLRPRVGSGLVPGGLSLVLGALVLMSLEGPGRFGVPLAAHLAAAAAYGIVGRRGPAAAVAHWTGLLGGSAVLALQEIRLGPLWLAGALAFASVWSLGALAFARRRRLSALADQVALGLALAAVAWGAWALAGAFDTAPNDLHLRLVAAVLLLATCVLAARGAWEARTPAPAALLVVAALLGYLAGLGELIDRVAGLSGAWPAVSVSLYSMVFTGGVLALGFARDDRRLRYVALAGFGILVGKVGLHDLAASSLPLRVLVSGVLGLVLLASAWGYARNRRRRAPPEAASG